MEKTTNYALAVQAILCLALMLPAAAERLATFAESVRAAAEKVVADVSTLDGRLQAELAGGRLVVTIGAAPRGGKVVAGLATRPPATKE